MSVKYYRGVPYYEQPVIYFKVIDNDYWYWHPLHSITKGYGWTDGSYKQWQMFMKVSRDALTPFDAFIEATDLEILIACGAEALQ